MEQLLANILFLSSTIFLVGISFSLIFSTAKFFHFAHAAIITSGVWLLCFFRVVGLSDALIGSTCNRGFYRIGVES